MQIQNFNPPGKRELGEAPDWFVRYTDVLHTHLILLTNALQQNLTINENLNQDLRTVTLKHDSPQELTHKVTGTLRGVIAVGTEIADFPVVRFTPKGEKRVEVTVSWPTAPTAETEVTLLFIGT